MNNFFANIFGVQSKITYLLTLFFRGRFIGSDQYNNKYYVGKTRKGYTKERRFVRFENGVPEASQIPPEFHGWLHHQTDKFPDANQASYRKPWQKPHTQNLTGTTLAYRPDGAVLNGGQRAPTTGDYEAWTPE
jgi:NADH:ubiquinone oxidoreductase subunit